LDLALVAEAVGDGLTPRDVALRREIIAPRARTEHLRRLQNALAVVRDPLTEAELDASFHGDSLRLFQRVLVRVDDWDNYVLFPAVQRARADSILALAQAGASFDRLAMSLSEGPNAANGGYLGVVGPAGVEESLRGPLWGLEPGDVSLVLRIDAGFQVLRRPPLAEVRQPFAAHLLRAAGARADALLTDSLAAAHGLALLPTSARRLRAVLANPDSLAADSAVVVRFDDGGITPAEAWIWLSALPDAQRLSLTRASVVQLEEAARALARNELLYRMARSRGIEVADADLAEPLAEFTTAADSLFAMFAGADAQRRAQLVDSIVGAVVAGSPTRTLPAGLAPALRRRVPHAFDRDALAAAARLMSGEVVLPGS
jgi:hypothetical protein